MKFFTRVFPHLIYLTLLTQLTLLPCALRATTVFGNLTDISVQALNTKMIFAPTSEVMVAQSGLSAGPPKIITTTNGAFSLPLEPGNYTVSLPLITWRHPFAISVFDNPTPINITNLLAAPHTYTYTNPFVPPLHVNTAGVTTWSTNGESTLLTSSATIGAGSLAAGRVITIEAFGSFSDPDGESPSATIKLKLGTTTILTETHGVTDSNWNLRACVTVRTNGASGSVAGTAPISLDNPDILPFQCGTTITTLNTTVSLTVDLTASIDDFTGAEAIHCEQLVIHLD